VAIKDKREDTLAFVRKSKLTYPILMDPQGDIGALYGAFATPTVYLIDRKGTVLARQWGPAGWNSPAARKLIDSLVENK
jgi:peroxiredoxin